MSVKWETKFDKLPQMKMSTETISGRSVEVGALTGEHAWLAGILEYGCEIKAKKAKYLTVPVCSEAAGRKASEFKNLFVYTSKKGNKMLARNEGGELKFYYWLTPSVKIPPRNFLRNGHDENVDRIIKQTELALGQVLIGKMSIDTLLDTYGEQMATAIKKYMVSYNEVPNNDITAEVKGDNNPLIGKTKALHNGIMWRKR